MPVVKVYNQLQKSTSLVEQPDLLKNSQIDEHASRMTLLIGKKEEKKKLYKINNIAYTYYTFFR